MKRKTSQEIKYRHTTWSEHVPSIQVIKTLELLGSQISCLSMVPYIEKSPLICKG